MNPKPNEAEVFATTMPLPDYSGWEGWYCHAGHPEGEAMANAADRPNCWACGTPKAMGGTPKGLGTAVTVVVDADAKQLGN
jgi:hypothetical protein